MFDEQMERKMASQTIYYDVGKFGLISGFVAGLPPACPLPPLGSVGGVDGVNAVTEQFPKTGGIVP